MELEQVFKSTLIKTITLKNTKKVSLNNQMQKQILILVTILSSHQTVFSQYAGGVGGGGSEHVVTGLLGEYISLPIALLDFEVAAMSSKIKKTQLTCFITPHVNISHYDVEWSSDGKIWTKIGVVEYADIDSGLQSFSFIHNEAQTINYYRLGQKYSNGTLLYSSIKSVVFNQDMNKQLAIVYPNPSSNVCHILTNSDNEAFFEITDLTGTMVKKGAFENQVTLMDLKPGLYFVKINIDNQFETHRLIITY